ncbi:cysteine--tRNA ligase [Candidatus Curtissbacteria bacterium]|nr:cysteine--tRNA ligase [Candidatus Curtissbacteria bacterium]
MKLYNFLSRQIEEFKPIGKTVNLYTCGPTVYDYVHIGNWRTFVFEDILKRVLTFNDYEVKHVMNLTDIDDKIIIKANEKKIPIQEFTEKYAKAFFADLSKLNILPADIYPRATESIDSMVDLIQKLLNKGIAYKGEDGIYFSVEKFPGYGKLSGLDRKNLKRGARVDSDEYDKESWTDFALWKFPPSHKASEGKSLREPSWDAPFGAGRPGWHIECSAMSIAELGDPSIISGRKLENFRTIDIHTGGVDLLFPHHENEIAQSEAATGKKFVNYWMEGEHLLVEGEKMAKRLGNVYTPADIKKKGIDPLALRYLFLSAHYRSKLNFTWESLKAAQNALNNLRGEISNWEVPKIGCAEFEGKFKEAICDDLNMPQALAVMWEMVKSDYPASAKHQSILKMDEVLGLGFPDLKKIELPKGTKELIEKREELRKQSEFEESDKLRKELLEMGVEVEDTAKGPKWRIKK